MNMDWKNTFHKRINELWEKAKDRDYRLTQTEYANRLGVTRNSLLGWLRGAGQPDADGFVNIATVECVSLEWLLGDDRQADYAILGQGEREMLMYYRGMTDAHKADMFVMAKHFYTQDNPAPEKINVEKRVMY